MLYLLWVIVLLMLLCTFVTTAKYNNGFVFLTCVLAFNFLFIILGWASGAYDVEISALRYNEYEYYSTFTEMGYSFLISLAKSLGLTYRGFMIFCALFELLVLFWFARKNSESWLVAIALFLVYPFVVYFQYTRSILAFAFIMIALDQLINKPKGYIVKYVALVLIASSIHMSSLFFMLYLVSVIPNKKFLNRLIGISFAVLLVAPSVLSGLYSVVGRYLGDTKVGILTRSIDASGQFGRIFALVFTIMVFWVPYFFIKRREPMLVEDDFSEVMKVVNMMSFILIPLTLNFALGFSRIATLLLPINFVYISNKFGELEPRERTNNYLLLIILLICLNIIMYRNVEYRELVLYPYFEQNEFLDWLF